MKMCSIVLESFQQETFKLSKWSQSVNIKKWAHIFYLELWIKEYLWPKKRSRDLWWKHATCCWKAFNKNYKITWFHVWIKLFKMKIKGSKIYVNKSFNFEIHGKNVIWMQPSQKNTKYIIGKRWWPFPKSKPCDYNEFEANLWFKHGSIFTN
jgi:hypothetical protein